MLTRYNHETEEVEIASPSIDMETGEIRGLAEFELTARGLVVHGTPTFGEWVAYGLHLRDIKRSVQWALGDWINYGERTYGQKYAQALEATDYDYGTLRNYSYVASRFELSRRDDNLTFAHHVVVAPLPPEKADALLIEAKTNELTRDELREKVKVAQGKPPTSKPKPIFDNTLPVGQITLQLMRTLDGRKMVRVVVYEVTQQQL